MAGKLSSKETVFGIYSKSFADPVIKILHNPQTAYSLEMRYNIQQLYQVDGLGMIIVGAHGTRIMTWLKPGSWIN